MKRAYEMTYLHKTDARAMVEPVPYSSRFKDRYKRLYNSCYHEMREALGIEPYDFIQDDAFFHQSMDQVYLLIDGDTLIGSVALKGCEIDDLLVAPEFQGRGYGRQLLIWALENIDYDKIVLHVAEWNQRAIALYKSVGFEITETFEI